MTETYATIDEHLSLGIQPLQIKISRVLPLADASVIVASSVLTTIVYDHATGNTSGDILQSVMLGTVFAIALCMTAWLKRLYTRKSWSRLEVHIINLLAIWLGIVASLSFAAFCLKIGHAFSRGATLSFIGVTPLLLIALRLTGVAIRGRLQHASWIEYPSSMLVSISGARDIETWTPVLGDYRPAVRRFTYPLDGEDTATFARRLCQQLRGSDVEQLLLVTDGTADRADLRQILSALETLPLPVLLFPDPDLSAIIASSDRDLPSFPIRLHRGSPHGPSHVAKTLFDRSLALIALLVLAPLLLSVALVIRMESSGPAIFFQYRRGFNGRPFRIYKFRTMTVAENGTEVKQARRNDSRVTPFGRWLRRNSIDELPQLINVLLGDMSIVGPRPHAVAHDEYYAALIETYAHRHYVKPGLTGWAQINGSRGETPTVDHMKKRVELDLWYIRNWRFTLDLWIVLRTTLEVVRGSNAF